MKEKKRPTLEELRLLPRGLWELELAHIGVEAMAAGLWEIDADASRLFADPALTPEMVVELREKLQRATGSTDATIENWLNAIEPPVLVPHSDAA